MLLQFKEFIRTHHMLPEQGPSLLAVSGGIDSVAMMHLYHSCGIPAHVAHCNFHLRGEASDEDARFVEALAAQWQMKCFVKDFDTENYAREHGISIQMAARDLRYFWFKELMQQHGYPKVATGHHRDDHLETFFINLMRGTGLRGLHGIPPVKGPYVRPLLFAGREQIKKYMQQHHLHWREDSSNATTKYLRNKIRHQVFPVLRNIDPDFEKTMLANTERFAAAEHLYITKVHEIITECVRNNDPLLYLDLEKLQVYPEKETVLFEWLSSYGFGMETATAVAKLPLESSGQVFFSQQYRLVKNRQELILQKKPKESGRERYEITEAMEKSEVPFPMTIKREKIHGKSGIRKDPRVAILDLEKIRFPLVFRKWRQGDRFKPLGMKHNKKLSDFFIDNKFSLPEKERVWVLESGGKIAWVAGHRISEDFSITDSSAERLIIELMDV
jgi:tRNA(Ile)-lysidine synthase